MLLLMVILIVLASGTAVVGLVLLSQATQGVGILALACLLAIFARMAQAGGQGSGRPDERVGELEGRIRPPADGPWPPAIGERLALVSMLVLRTEPDRNSKRGGLIHPRTRFEVLAVQNDWLFVQTEDGRTEGWVETTTVPRRA